MSSSIKEKTATVLVTNANDKEKYCTTDLKICYSIWKKKGDGVIPSKADKVRSHTMMLENRESLTIKSLC